MKVAAIDFDATISKYTGWRGKGNFGAAIDGVRVAHLQLKQEGYTIIINTTRLEVDLIKEYLERWKIPYDYVNFNPQNIELDLHPSKLRADIYIDDKAVTFEGKWDDEFIKKIIEFKPWWKK